MNRKVQLLHLSRSIRDRVRQQNTEHGTIDDSHLTLLSQASDQEVAVLALATLANILAFADTLLLADVAVVDTLGTALPHLMLSLRTSQQRPQRYSPFTQSIEVQH